MQGPLTFFLAFVAVLVLIGAVAWGVRRYATNRLGANTNRGRMPRLAVIDAAAVDGRRRLVLVRRDNVEHLLMIGGPSDIVVEPNIVRAMPGREQMAPRPSVGGEQPPRIAPLPDANWSDDSAFDHAEPQMPEPPQRPVRPAFADEVRRPAPPPIAERRNDRSDPLAGFTPEPIGNRPEPRPDPIPPRLTRPERSEPMMPRPQRPIEPPKAPPPVRPPERAAAPPLPPPPPAPPPSSNADQNLAEMAQRLEAALRRPADAPIAPPVAPEPPSVRPARSEAPPPAPAPTPQKSGFENLEDEMASLLGRPKNSS
jgi:flagellar biogenesis protein FliO